MTAKRRAPEKLHLDFFAGVVLRVAMDEHDELATRLLALAGAFMEDASVVAIIGQNDMILTDRVSAVARSATHALHLAHAASLVLANR